MKQWTGKIIGGLLALFCCLFVSGGLLLAAPDLNEPSLRIGLMTKQFGILAESNGTYEIVNVDTNAVIGEYAAGVKTRIGLREGKFVINNTVVEGERFRIAPRKSKSMERENTE